MAERIDLAASSQSLYQAVIELDRLVSERAATAGIAEGFSHILRLRASQINGCSYCVRLHARDALASGESADRVALVSAWRESEYFSLKERAALGLVESITLVSDGQVPDGIYELATKTLSREELAAVEWLAIVINSWNRIAIASRYQVKP